MVRCVNASFISMLWRIILVNIGYSGQVKQEGGSGNKTEVSRGYEMGRGLNQVIMYYTNLCNEDDTGNKHSYYNKIHLFSK